MNDIFETVAAGALALGLITLTFVLAFGVALPLYNDVTSSVKIYVDDREVYAGRALCASVNSSGSTTKVSVGCVGKKWYVSNNVKVEPL